MNRNKQWISGELSFPVLQVLIPFVHVYLFHVLCLVPASLPLVVRQYRHALPAREYMGVICSGVLLSGFNLCNMGGNCCRWWRICRGLIMDYGVSFFPLLYIWFRMYLTCFFYLVIDIVIDVGYIDVLS